MKKQWHLIAISLFAVVIALVYFAPFANNFFAYDSFRYIENLFAGPWKVLLGYNAFRVVSNFMWYPLYWLFGFEPTGYTMFNASLFALNAVLLYMVAEKLWGERELALVVAALFVLSGTTVDAVFWHMSMSTLLCASFYLLTIKVYITFRQSGNMRQWLVALVLFTVAMFTKEDAASMPFVIVLLEVFFFDGLHDLKGVVRRVMPFCLVVIGYIVIGNVVFYLAGVVPEAVKFFKFRPWYSLLGAYSVFFLPPGGSLDLSFANPYILVTAAAVVASFFIVQNRRQLLFAYCWMFVTFLPQSLSAIGQFQPKYIFNSISRLLYLSNVGAALVVALLLLQLKSLLPRQAVWGVIGVCLALVFCLNYSRVQSRGAEWRDDAEPVRIFLTELKKRLPRLPDNTHFFAINGPTGRAYMQQSLRAFYGNPTITWIVDPMAYAPRPDVPAILLDVNWAGPNRIVDIEIVPFSQEALLQRAR